jgi:2-phosphosulfolactate phosphatase
MSTAFAVLFLLLCVHFFMSLSSIPRLEVCLSPALLHLYDVEEVTVVLIDVFRATSTITAVLHNGAQGVVPVASVAEAIELGRVTPNSITGGERDGKIAPGLQYGNSPLEYPSSFVAGKTLILTTTNGTRLLHMIHGAREIVIGSMLNVDTVCDYLLKRQNNALLACASWKDRFNIEDTLFAGAVVQRVGAHFDMNCDSGRAARTLYRSAQEIGMWEFIKDSSHYRRLSAFGLERDMEYCLQENRHPVLPILRNGTIVTAS